MGLVVVGVAMVAVAVGWAATARDTTPRPAPVTTSVPVLGSTEASVFAVRVTKAVADHDTAFLLAHLDPVVTGVFGVDACTTFVNGMHSQSVVSAQGTSGPGDYAWIVDDMSVVVSGVWTVHVKNTIGDAEVHVGTASGQPTWFADCGTPLPVADQRLPAYARRP